MSDWLDEGGTGSPVDVAAILDSRAVDHAWRVVQAGALVSFGRTSDGGALGVTVTVDGRWRRDYFRDAEDLTTWLEGAAAYAEDWAAQESAGSVTRKRQRRRRE
jgi:hypothetical protein